MANQEKIKTLIDSRTIKEINPVPSGYPEWFNDFKHLSIENLMDQCLPSNKDNQWESTRISSLTELLINNDFIKSNKINDSDDKDQGKDKSTITIEFRNGQYFCPDELPGYIKILSQNKNKDQFRKIFDMDMKKDSSFASTLNSAMLTDLLLIETSINQKVDTIIHIVNCSTQQAILAPRIEIHAAENSSLKIFEEVNSSAASIINHVLGIDCQNKAEIEFYKIIHSQHNSHYLGTQNIKIHEDALLNCFLWDYGGDTSKTETDTKLLGQESQFNYSALFTPIDDLHSGSQIKVHHQANRTKSRVKVRGVLRDRSSGAFFGKVKVNPDVIKTSALMENKNLLLSDEANISTKPILEIYNDDTECSHSATSGSIDEEKLFYLKSRGIDEVQAKSFLIKSFIEEISGAVKNKKINEAFKNYFTTKS